MYKIRFSTPDSLEKKNQWFSVENVTALWHKASHVEISIVYNKNADIFSRDIFRLISFELEREEVYS